MNFRTIVEPSLSPFSITHQDHIQVFGSCFAENIGRLLTQNKFNVDCNPFGVLYNPSSICQALQLLINKPNNGFYEPFLLEQGGRWVSLLHHSDFAAHSKQELLALIEQKYSISSEVLASANRLIITFGTAFVFQHTSLNHTVSNCHKLPATQFHRYRLDIKTIVGEWTQLINQLLSNNPALRIIFTVSPIRHWKDGAHDNQLSKSILLLAIDELCSLFGECTYFPSYELMMDDLRDYRFYAEDMNHPSEVAVDYIWNKFASAYFTEPTNQLIQAWNPIDKALRHKPFSTSTSTYRQFIADTMDKLNTFAEKYPFIDLEKERVRLGKSLP